MKLSRLFLPVFLALAAVPALSSCSGKVDYVSQCRLDASLSYSNKNFLDNGIGQVSVKKFVDGDTTHFNQTEERARLVKIRYLGVDTPESTGQIEPWGKAASNFTKKKLEKAKTIVLTKDIPDIGSAAEVDSTGSRFKGFVWISEKANAKVSELKCLNLWLVQEGYSTGKGLSGSPLTKYFTEADLQAQKLKLHIWSEKDDPNFYQGPAVQTSLKELAETFDEDASESSFNGAKVTLEGVVCKRSGEYDAFLVDTDEEGNEYGLYVFAGYKSYAPLITLGNRIKVTGNYTIYYGNPQLTNVSYNAFLPGEDDITVISTNNPYEIRESTVAAVSNRASVNKVVTLNNLSVYNGYTEIDKTTEQPSGALTLRTKDSEENQISVRIPEDVWVRDTEGSRVRDWAYFNNKVISLTGCINFYAPNEDDPDNGYYQIKLCVTDDFHVVG